MTRNQEESTQNEQAKLLAEALKQPGVAEVAETYGKLAGYTPAPIGQQFARSGYGVGGNA
jgi:hypothetical protein